MPIKCTTGSPFVQVAQFSFNVIVYFVILFIEIHTLWRYNNHDLRKHPPISFFKVISPLYIYITPLLKYNPVGCIFLPKIRPAVIDCEPFLSSYLILFLNFVTVNPAIHPANAIRITGIVFSPVFGDLGTLDTEADDPVVPAATVVVPVTFTFATA